MNTLSIKWKSISELIVKSWDENIKLNPFYNGNTVSTGISKLKKGDQVLFYGVIMLITDHPKSRLCQQDRKTIIWNVPCRITEFSKIYQTPIASNRGLLYGYDNFQSIDDGSRSTSHAVIKQSYLVPLTEEEIKLLK